MRCYRSACSPGTQGNVDPAREPMMSLRERLATPEGKRRYVRTLFATIADRYDLITIALSYGQDRRWKQRLVGMVASPRGALALDLATGTGDIAFGLASRGAQVVGLDITQRMIELARKKTGAPHPTHFLVGDMLALPFPSGSYLEGLPRIPQPG